MRRRFQDERRLASVPTGPIFNCSIWAPLTENDGAIAGGCVPSLQGLFCPGHHRDGFYPRERGAVGPPAKVIKKVQALNTFEA
jgi:hypothetical protein